MMFEFVFDRRMPINDPMVFNLRLHASITEHKGQEMHISPHGLK